MPMVTATSSSAEERTDDLAAGTTPLYANMHEWIKRAVLIRSRKSPWHSGDCHEPG